MEEDDEFFDTLSLTSGASLARKKFHNHNNYFSVSSNSLYHSVADFDMEMDNLDGAGNNSMGNHVNQVSTNPKTITYLQWRDRVFYLKHFLFLIGTFTITWKLKLYINDLCMMLSTLCQHCLGEGIWKY